MKKLLNNKNFIQKIMILLVAMILFNFTVPISSHAGFGGMLLDPIADLITTVTDGILSVLQACLYSGTLLDDSLNGFMNIILNASWYMLPNARDAYPEMKCNNPDDAQITIDDSEFKQLNFYDIVTTLVNPVIGGIKIIGEITGAYKPYSIPTIQYSVDKIFTNKVPAFDINFIKPTYSDTTYVDDINNETGESGGDGYDDNTGYTEEAFNSKKEKSIAYVLHDTIASWYVSLRNLAAVGLLSVLLYAGIRILISSTASDKAKYKQNKQEIN